MGTPLLERHSRGVATTPAGKIFHQRAREILALVAQCSRELAEFREKRTETLTLGASGSIVQLCAAHLLTQAQTTMPDVLLRLVEDSSLPLYEAFRRGELDVVLAHELPATPGFEVVPWLREDLLFVTAPDSGGSNIAWSPEDPIPTIELREALQTELTLPVRLDGIRKIIRAAAEPLGLHYRVTFAVQSHQALKILIADQSVASVLPYGLVANELRSGALRGRRIVAPALSRTLYLVRSSRRLSGTNELALTTLLTSLRLRLANMLGPLASPIESD